MERCSRDMLSNSCRSEAVAVNDWLIPRCGVAGCRHEGVLLTA
ncbi:hypothetical protein SynMVIR181_00012 [Synechococcus sp. MVIR-18-1]|nr:hypothetical protein SynMVIR181_00012 [Synechococcus sp. MVIR-18-1]